MSSPIGASFINNPGLCHDSTRSALLVRVRVLVRSPALGSAAWCSCCGTDQRVTDPAAPLTSGQAASGRSFLLQQEGVAGAARWPRVGSPAPQRHLTAMKVTDCVLQVWNLCVMVSVTAARRLSSCRLEEGLHRPPVVGAGFTAFSQSKQPLLKQLSDNNHQWI